MRLEELQISSKWGDFKHELGPIELTGFYSFGPSAYNVTYVKDNQIVEVSKMMGFKLQQTLSEESVSSKMFCELIQSALIGKKANFPLVQARKRQTMEYLGHELITFFIKNEIRAKRIIVQDGNFSLPYGISKNILQLYKRK